MKDGTDLDRRLFFHPIERNVNLSSLAILGDLLDNR